MVSYPQPSVQSTDKYLKWETEQIGNLKKLVLYVYAEEGIWVRYTQSPYYQPDTIIPGKGGENIGSLGFRTAQHCLKLGFKYDMKIT